jgi:hypothetical protein
MFGNLNFSYTCKDNKNPWLFYLSFTCFAKTRKDNA